MIVAQERGIFKAQAEFESMLEMVREAAAKGICIYEVEKDLWSQVLSVGRALLEGFVDQQGKGDFGEEIEYEGRTLRRLEGVRDRRYVSVFGEIAISRVVYGKRERQKQEVVPLDARLGLPDSDFSYLLQEWDQSLCVQDSYEESSRTVERILGIGQSVRSLEHMNRAMADDVESFRESQPLPPAEEEGSIAVITADGKGVPMRREGETEEFRKHGRRKKGEKANKKRMACVGAVYTIDPFERTPEDVVNEVMREICREDRPVPQHKQLRAELTREIDGEEVLGKDITFAWIAKQIRERGLGKTLVCVMDGERALWKMVKKYVENAVCILDLFHVMERLWAAAHCFHPEGSKEAEEFVTERLGRILEGEVGRVIGGLKQMSTKQGLRGSRKTRLDQVLVYLENNRSYMRYDEYLAAGYPIGSGVAEGACRHLVKDRMELTGMRWRTEGAQAMLDLRAVHLNGEWDAFQKHRVERNTRELYPYREEIQAEWKAAA
jgi:hypothetical protein